MDTETSSSSASTTTSSSRPTCSRATSRRSTPDDAPRVQRNDDGADVWIFDGSVIPNVGLNAVAGRPKEEYGIEPDGVRRDAARLLRRRRARQGHERRRRARLA